MNQNEINAAMRNAVYGNDAGALERMIGAIRSEVATVHYGVNCLTIRSMPTLSLFTQQMRLLRRTSGCTIESIANDVGMADSSVYRILSGTTFSTWPIIRDIIKYCGGNPEDYRDLWKTARDEKRAAAALRRKSA